MGKTGWSSTTGNPIKAKKAGVQTAYTEQDISAIVHAKKDAGKSLRAIAAEYGFPVNHMDIERILQGHFPHNAAKRKALGLPPICVSCGQRVKPARVVPEWVELAVDNLRELSRLARAPQRTRDFTSGTGPRTETRVYDRNGKQVHHAGE